MKIRPIGDRILVQRDVADTTTEAGIIIPDIAQKKAMRCTVMAVGRGRIDDSGTLHEPSVKVGDKVLIGKYSGSEADLTGEALVFVREEDILGVVEE